MGVREAVIEFMHLDEEIGTSQWRQAELTWEQAAPDGTKDGRMSLSAWAREVGKSNWHIGVLWHLWDDLVRSTSHDQLPAELPPFNEAYQTAAEGPDWAAKQDARRATSALNQIPVEQQAEEVRRMLADPAVASAAFDRTDAGHPGTQTTEVLGNIAQARQAGERRRLEQMHERMTPGARETNERIGTVGAKLELDEATLAFKTACRSFVAAISAALPQAGPYGGGTGRLSFAELAGETTAEHTTAGRILTILAEYVTSERAGSNLDHELAKLLGGE
jgi:hypothetical protein